MPRARKARPGAAGAAAAAVAVAAALEMLPIAALLLPNHGIADRALGATLGMEVEVEVEEEVEEVGIRAAADNTEAALAWVGPTPNRQHGRGRDTR